MSIAMDPMRARAVGERLYHAFRGAGILGEISMPEHLLPLGVERGSREQLHFITLTVAIDYMRDADALWAASRQTFADPTTRYLYTPRQVAQTTFAKLATDMGKYKLAKKLQKDAEIWRTICLTLVQHFGGDVLALLQQAAFDASRVLETIRQARYRFPYLKGPKIGPLWVRMLEDSWQGHHFVRLEKLPIPVDIHIGAATLMTGCLHGTFAGPFDEFREAVVQVWSKACQGTAYYPLQFDEPLWHLSRRGCRNTPGFPCVHKRACPVEDFCTSTELKVNSGASAGPAVQFISHR